MEDQVQPPESEKNQPSSADAQTIAAGVPADDGAGASSENLDRILDLKILVTVNVGSVKMTLKELLALQPGAIIEVQKRVEEPLALSTNNNRKQIAHGEVVAIGENLGIRILEKQNHEMAPA